MIRNEIAVIEFLKKHDEKLKRIEKLLSNQKEIMTIEEVAEFTGLSLSYIYKLVHYRKIPYSKPFGKTLYFQRSKIQEIILKDQTKSQEEIDMDVSSISVKKR